MSSTKRFSLSQVALQSSCAHNALNSVRNFYLNSGATNVVLQRQKSACMEMGSSPANKAARVGHLSKVIGVKKTLVNQMQGMVQKLRPHVRSQSSLLLQKNNCSKYRIYGQTRMFSSRSSLASNNTVCQSPSRQLQQLQRRRLSHTSHQFKVTPQKSVVQQRYSQLGLMHDRRKGEMAKDISRSIQSELMDIDLTTKRLISYARNKPDLLANSEQDDEEQEEQLQRQQMQQQQRQLRLQHENFKQHHPLRYSPFLGWKRSRSDKPTEEETVDDKNDSDTFKLSRRNPKEQPQEQQKDVVKSRKLKAKLSELYASSHRKNRNLQYQSSVASESTKQLESDAVKQSQYNQMSEERDANTSDRDRERERERERERQSERNVGSAGSNRMDNLHYQTKIVSKLMSASQRVYNKRFEGFRYQSEARHKATPPVIIKKTVQPVSLMAQKKSKNENKSTASKGQKNSNIRPLSARCMHKPDGKSVSPHVTPKARAQKKLLKKLGQSMSKSGKQDLPVRMDTVMRLKNINNSSNWSRPTHANYEQHLRQVCEMPRGQNIHLGEMREPQKSDENYTSDSLQNDVQMPREYTKESAVRRLGSGYDRRIAHPHFAEQRMHV